MTLRYATIDNLRNRLSGRLTLSNAPVVGVTGSTGTTIGLAVIETIGEGIEQFVDLFLGMIYELPLKATHPYVVSIVERLIVAEVFNTYFPSQSEMSEGGGVSGGFSAQARSSALDDFQVLFDGTGVFVPGANNSSNQKQNVERDSQMVVKTIILPGETLKPYIGYDIDKDGVSDTDLFKVNSNISPSFYSTGEFDGTSGEDVIEGVRVRAKDYDPYRVDIDFW